MAEVEVIVDVDAPLDEALDLIGDFEVISDYHPQVAGCQVEGEGVGALRTCTLSDGSTLTERLEDDREDGYAYAMIEGPEPLARYTGAVSIREREGGCRVTWTARFEVKPGRSEERMIATMRGIIETGLESAKRMLEG